MRGKRKTLWVLGEILLLALSLPLVSWAQEKKAPKPKLSAITMLPNLSVRNDTVTLNSRDTELFFDLKFVFEAKSSGAKCFLNPVKSNDKSVGGVPAEVRAIHDKTAKEMPTDSVVSIVVDAGDKFFPTPGSPVTFVAFCYGPGGTMLDEKRLTFTLPPSEL